MAGVAEKARLHLERSVPQLREWQEKEIFTAEEIRNIVQKRNGFEHLVLSPGNLPTDWSSYARWEKSLESLRSKRCKRLKVYHLNSAYQGQGRVLAIYDRAVNRHPGSSALWREYLEYTQTVKAAKRWRRTMTSALRMMPTDPGLWIAAGSRSAQNGDMAAARGYFMRGCRFCTKDARLWLEYARVEMEWLQKVDKRKRNNDSDPLRADKTEDDDFLQIANSDADEDDSDKEADGPLLPEPSRVQANVIDKRTSKQLASNPAMDGAIPIAIFSIASKQSFFSADVAEEFFELFATFRNLSAQQKISSYVLSTLDEQFPNEPATGNCHVREPIAGLSLFSPEFPRNLRNVLPLLVSEMEKTVDRQGLLVKTRKWIDECLAVEDLDEGIRLVLQHTSQTLAT